MSDGIERPGQPNSDGEGSGVLANLPRTRPQRASPRRAAARRTEAEKTDGAAAQTRSGERSGPRGARAPSTAPAAATGAGETTTAKGRAPGPGASRRAARNRPAKRASGAQGRARRSTPNVDAVPRQGYESDDDAATGAVQPPGGAELLISAAEIVGELAKAGVSRSERLLKDVLSRLPLS
ncbi:MAG TPA: hypothetical protein VGW98_13050 [Solirubrobacteraceae bacterium]|nr:hypothetical protein [Solirubrobacteraceae bacterium]